MKMYNGYEFYFTINGEVLVLPITPSELTIKNGSKNKVVTLINDGDINILKSPSLTDIEFEARFPMRKYPYSREPLFFEDYLKKFTRVKESKKPFRFKVTRATPDGKETWGTDWLVALEELETYESADNGDDVIVKFKLKQYKEYGVKTVQVENQVPTSTSTSDTVRSTENAPSSELTTYPIKSGDTLCSIAKYFYGNAKLYTKILEANRTGLDNEAKKHGKQSSSNGHWIYVGYTLTIPPK